MAGCSAHPRPGPNRPAHAPAPDRRERAFRQYRAQAAPTPRAAARSPREAPRNLTNLSFALPSSRPKAAPMTERQFESEALAKVPAVTLGFWIIKILATTLGETGGDTVTMTWLGET